MSIVALKPLVIRLASLKITVCCLAMLMILTIVGTLDQVEHGLYAAQNKIFFSWFFIAFKGIPLPGVRLVLWVLFVNLLSALIVKFRWKWRNTGLAIVHIGLLLLFVGSFGKFHWGQETHLTLMEEDGSNLSASYRDWEIALFKDSGTNERDVWAVDVAELTNKDEIRIEDLQQSLKIHTYYQNSLAYRKGPKIADVAFTNASGIVYLEPQNLIKEAEKNVPGIILQITGDTAEPTYVLLYGLEQKSTAIKIKEETYWVSLRQKRYLLPLFVELLDVTRELYPGTETPKSYASRVKIDDGHLQREVHISMNKPLRYKDYTLFQASYGIDAQGKEQSIFAVAYNPFRYLPYVSSLAVVVGLLLHFMLMLARRWASIVPYAKKIIVLSALLLGAQTGFASDESAHHLDLWRELVILEDGRIKPMEAFAQNQLLQLSGKKRWNKQSALAWLVRTMTTPDKVGDDKVFQIDHPEVVEALGMTAVNKRRYAWNDLMPHLPTLSRLVQEVLAVKEDERTYIDQEFLRVFHNVQLYQSLKHSLSFALPQASFLIEDAQLRADLKLIEKPGHRYSFFDMFEKVALLQMHVNAFVKKPRVEWTPAQKDIFKLAQSLFVWMQNAPPSLLNTVAVEQHEGWRLVSPLDVLQNKLGDTYVAHELRYWAGLTYAYQVQDVAQQQEFLAALVQQQYASGLDSSLMRRMALERTYHKWNLLLWAYILYILIFLGAMALVMRFSFGLYRIVGLMSLLAVTGHTGALIVRMMIMQRPPVSTLYETFVFVGLIAVLVGLFLEFVFKRVVGFVLIGLSGFVMLSIAKRYADDGDTFQVLQAVLNSNFWLSTHVVTITIGYGLCCAAGVLGHIYLLQEWRQGSKAVKHLSRMIYGVLAAGLVFTFLGTILGGIWADQSWGRFWGWDPKENGALLIVLWCALLFHARWDGMLRDRGIAMGAIVGMIWVMLAWFGINLLGVGLHSYGFTSGLARNLYMYIGFEVIFLGLMLVLLKVKKQAIQE